MADDRESAEMRERVKRFVTHPADERQAVSLADFDSAVALYQELEAELRRVCGSTPELCRVRCWDCLLSWSDCRCGDGHPDSRRGG